MWCALCRSVRLSSPVISQFIANRLAPQHGFGDSPSGSVSPTSSHIWSSVRPMRRPSSIAPIVGASSTASRKFQVPTPNPTLPWPDSDDAAASLAPLDSARLPGGHWKDSPWSDAPPKAAFHKEFARYKAGARWARARTVNGALLGVPEARRTWAGPGDEYDDYLSTASCRPRRPIPRELTGFTISARHVALPS